MKNRAENLFVTLAWLALSTLNPQFSTVFAQGSLTPPGPPAPTMKTASQIEPRTLISSAPFVITNSGSYYLTTNLSVNLGNAIFISANQVTLDLNGFTISSTDGANLGSGILLNNATNVDITILNGHITSGVTNNGSGVFSGPGFAHGIWYSGGIPNNVRVTGVSVSGCLQGGIIIGQNFSSVVESCSVSTVGADGINADLVSRCSVNNCRSNGINAHIASDCVASCVAGNGINVDIANNSYGNSTGGNGIFAIASANNSYGNSDASGDGIHAVTANNCNGSSFIGSGLTVTSSAIGCFGTSSGGDGINAFIANSCSVGFGAAAINYKYNMP